MDAFCDDRVREVAVMTSSQIGKTEALLNVIGFFMAEDPGPMLIVQPNMVPMGKAFSKERLDPMLRDTPALRGLTSEYKQRDATNTIESKLFPGGHLAITGSNSPAGLASRPIRFLLFDEVDRFEASAGNEGDPVDLARRRTAQFWNSIVGLFSTPGLKGLSRIDRAFEEGDQRYFWVACPHCTETQVLKWGDEDSVGGVKWERTAEGVSDPSTAFYQCEHCQMPWRDHERLQAVKHGEWIASRPFEGIASFHVWAAYAIAELSEMVVEWLKVKSNPRRRQVFWNTWLGLPYDSQSRVIEPDELKARAESYPVSDAGVRLVPERAVLLLATVDCQSDRFEITVNGWGAGEECWVLDYRTIDGDMSDPNHWQALHNFLTSPYETERGDPKYIRASAIDSGAYTQSVYAFAKPRHQMRLADGSEAYLFAIKGVSGVGTVWPSEPSFQEMKRRDGSKKSEVPLYPVKVDVAKDEIAERLYGVQVPGPSFIHFHDGLPERYFAGLTAEKSVIEPHPTSGFPRRIWKIKQEGMPNEPWDLLIYNYALLQGLIARTNFDIDRVSERMGIKPREEAEQELEVKQAPVISTSERPPEVPRPPGGKGIRRIQRRRISHRRNR